MGIGEWSKIPVKPGSVFNTRCNLPPGEYWMMYDQSSQSFIIKDINHKQVILKKHLNSPLDIIDMMTILTQHMHISENLETQINAAIEALKKQDTPHKIDGLIDHHIIPKHLWTKSELIKQAVKLTDIDLNGEENIIELPNKIHKSNHDFKSGYSELVIERLREEWNWLVDTNLYNNPDEVKATVLSLIAAIRADLEDLVSEDLSIGDWYRIALFNMFKKQSPKKTK